MNLKELQVKTIDELVIEGKAKDPHLAQTEDFYIWFDCLPKDVVEIKALFFMLGIDIKEVFERVDRPYTVFFHRSTFI